MITCFHISNSKDEKRVAAQCKLCPGEKVIRGSGLTSSNFISHLRVRADLSE